jgi:hypothetical protein
LPVYEEGEIHHNNAGEFYLHLVQKLNLSGQTAAGKRGCENAYKTRLTAQDQIFDLYLDPAFADARSTFENTELVETHKELEKFYFHNSSSFGFGVGKKFPILIFSHGIIWTQCAGLQLRP